MYFSEFSGVLQMETCCINYLLKLQLASSFAFLFSANQQHAKNTLFVGLWLKKSINQWRPNASKNLLVLMTPCWTSG